MKKYCLLILVVCLLLTLCGCSSKEAKNVITMIENLENIDENSKTQIDEVFEAYNALDEKDKKAVSNIEDLYAAQKEFEEYIPKYVSQKVSDEVYETVP